MNHEDIKRFGELLTDLLKATIAEKSYGYCSAVVHKLRFEYGFRYPDVKYAFEHFGVTDDFEALMLEVEAWEAKQ